MKIACAASSAPGFLRQVRQIVGNIGANDGSVAKTQADRDLAAQHVVGHRAKSEQLAPSGHLPSYFIVGMTKLAFSRTPPLGQRAVTVLTRV